MKTLAYQIEKALDIANNNPEARIGVICKWSEAREHLLKLAPYGINVGCREVRASSGAFVKFYDIYGFEMAREQLGGAVFSHVFVRGDFDYLTQAFIKSRLRSTKEFKEPMGYYDEIGVLRYEDY